MTSSIVSTPEIGWWLSIAITLARTVFTNRSGSPLVHTANIPEIGAFWAQGKQIRVTISITPIGCSLNRITAKQKR